MGPAKAELPSAKLFKKKKANQKNRVHAPLIAGLGGRSDGGNTLMGEKEKRRVRASALFSPSSRTHCCDCKI